MLLQEYTIKSIGNERKEYYKESITSLLRASIQV